MSNPRLTIVDMRSGRGLGGHSRDYLRALQDALRARSPETIAPFLDEPGPRLSVYVKGFFAYRRALADSGVAIVQNAGLNDYLCLAAAALTTRDRGACLAMLYRNPSPESFGAGAPWLNRAVIWLVTRQIRKGVLVPASDSKAVLEDWVARAPGVKGHLMVTPPLPAGDDDAEVELELPDVNPLVVIPGAMRAERGTANYPAVAEAVLAEFPDGGIAIQAAGTDPASQAITRDLEKQFRDDARVLVISRNLSGAEYRTLLEAAEIAVLPYDVDAYGAGSSGVVGDALATGTVVVAAPIGWIKDEFAGDERVVLVDQPSSMNALQAALRAASTVAHAGGDGADRAAEFAARWNAAVDALSR